MGAAVGAFAGIARTQLQCQRRTPQSAAGGLRSGGLVARKSVQCPVRDILARLGLADVKAFGLFWDDCNDYMKKLGYVLKIDAGLVA